jgi:hypothetical protein
MFRNLLRAIPRLLPRFLFLVEARYLGAQVSSADIAGTVTDQGGSSITNAYISIDKVATHARRVAW